MLDMICQKIFLPSSSCNYRQKISKIPSACTYSFSSGNEVEELSASCILKHHENLRLSIYELKELNRMWVVKSPEDLQLPLHFFEDSVLSDSSLVQDLDGDPMSSLLMEGHYNFMVKTHGYLLLTFPNDPFPRFLLNLY